MIGTRGRAIAEVCGAGGVVAQLSGYIRNVLEERCAVKFKIAFFEIFPFYINY